jgi:predicted DNA-binding transcriptional regulator
MPLHKKPLVPRFLAMSCQERDFLYELYVEQNKSAGEIAAKVGFSERFVYMRLKEYAITKDGYVRRQPVYCPTCGQCCSKKKKKRK